MAEVPYLNRYDQHCLDKLLNTSTEERLKAEGHIFTLSDGTEYEHEGGVVTIVPPEEPPILTN